MTDDRLKGTLVWMREEEQSAILNAQLRWPDEDWAIPHRRALDDLRKRYSARSDWSPGGVDRQRLARDAAELAVSNVPGATSDEIADAVLYALEQFDD